MLDANYQKHFKVLGKICKLYDAAGADVTTVKTRIAAFLDQIATGAIGSYNTTLLLNPYTGTLNQAVSAGSAAMQALAITMAGAYLTDPGVNFKGDLLVGPAIAAITNPSSPALVLEGLRLEMQSTGGGDNKKLTTEATTGFVNFFKNVLLSAAGAWNTIADASADYKDSVYVVDAVV